MTQLQRDAVWSYIAGFAEEVLPAEHFFYSNGRPFVLGWGADHLDLYTEGGEYEKAIGWNPRDALELGAMCNQAEDHRELARLAIRLARENDGLISFGDSLGGMANSVPGKLWKINDCDEDLTLPDWAQLLRYHHVGDAEFLENWLKHPGFRMIK